MHWFARSIKEQVMFATSNNELHKTARAELFIAINPADPQTY
jgi:hypothetical protein